MLVLAVTPGHDGAVAAVKDGTLLFSLEAEKDSNPRHSLLKVSTFLTIAELLPETPDVIAVSGWHKPHYLGTPIEPAGHEKPGAGYHGPGALAEWPAKLFGQGIRMFISSHERSHILMATGMASNDHSGPCAVLVWEGDIGSFYLLDERGHVTRCIPVMIKPGLRYGLLFALADPTMPDNAVPRLEDSGKLMALAAFGDPDDLDPTVVETVDRLVTMPWHSKRILRRSPLYNIGVEAQETKAAAALFTQRVFDVFAAAAKEHIPGGLPLYISGGCGLNCEWNVRWRELGHFSSVFVPPCTNDSGSAIGTAIDAQWAATGDSHINWSVYSGLEFEWDCQPDTGRWSRRKLEETALVQALSEGQIVAWVQGRYEIGPRALGNRSILAEPFDPKTRDRLNQIKQRESYRPIAPCCRLEDVAKAFCDDWEDPFMLYFKKVRSKDLGAVTHVDGTARVQTVTKETNKPLHDLLSAFAEHRGIGVLCNTSLNFKGMGFINRMSDLVAYCEATAIEHFVVGDVWFSRLGAPESSVVRAGLFSTVQPRAAAA